MITSDLYNNKKTAVLEGRFVKGPGGVPLDRQGRPVAPKAEPMRMRQWVVHHEGQRGEGGTEVIEAPNLETAWELANEYDLDIIDIKPVKGVAEDNAGVPVHRIGLTVTDPNHPMVSKRGETIQKTVRVTGNDREKAINSAIAHYRRKGYKVHDHHYIGTVDQGVAEGLSEMDKSQTPPGRDGSNDEGGKKEYPAKIITPKKAVKDGVKILNKVLNKKQGVAEVSRGDYRNKAMVSQAGAKIKKFLDRDDPAAVASADQTIAKREKGLARADARVKAYTPPAAAPVDLEKQQRDLTAKYPNIDELVRRAELNRDPDYEMADGQAYYAARDAEQNYQKLRQIQRVIQGLNESLNRSHLP